MKQIGIIGYYHSGNYGDDLMALAVARTVRKAGSVPTILGRVQNFEQYGENVTSDMDELVSSSDAIIMGGGGALFEFKSFDPNSFINRYFRFLTEIARRAGKRDIPLYAVSVGGDSKGVVRPLYAGSASFFTAHSFRTATVRLSADVECLDYMGATATYAPDIVLGTKSIFEDVTNQRVEKTDRLGIQGADRYLAVRAISLSKRRKIPQLVFVHTTVEDRDSFLESVPEARIAEHFVIDNNVCDTLRFISSLSAVIGHRLHFGVSALALGVPFYVVAPHAKTVKFFEDLEITLPLLRFDFIRRIAPPKIHSFHSSYAASIEIAQAISASAHHIRFVESICSN